MRAAVVSAPGSIEVTTVDDPAPGPGDVVLSVAACGICGTDLHISEGQFAPRLPVVPGHEFAGEVVALGAGVQELGGLRIGDRVAADPSLYCGECHYCRIGRGNQCERWGAIGVTEPGAAAEYVAVPAANCVRLPDFVETADAALIEPLSCAVRGYDVLRAAMASHYLIYGAGTMGLIMLQLAKRAGASTVDIVDLNPTRLETARLLGCSNAVPSAEEVRRRYGWDVVIDCTGVVAAIEDGLRRVGKGGTFLQFGVADENASASWSPYRVFREEITIVGSMAVLHSYERAAELFAAGVLDPAIMISDRLPLADYADALDRFRRGIGRKTLVVP